MVKCADCGLLGVREKSSGTIAEVTEDGRKNGREPAVMINENRIGPFLCCAQLEQFPWTKPGDTKSLLDRERNCNRFVAWQTGFLPKEHVQMDLIERQELWHERQRKSDRQFNAAIAIIAALLAGIMGIGGILLGAFMSKSPLPATPSAVAAPANPVNR